MEVPTAFTPDQPCSHSTAPQDIVPQVQSLPRDSQNVQQSVVSPATPAHCVQHAVLHLGFPSSVPAVPSGSCLHTQHKDTSFGDSLSGRRVSEQDPPKVMVKAAAEHWQCLLWGEHRVGSAASPPAQPWERKKTKRERRIHTITGKRVCPRSSEAEG